MNQLQIIEQREILGKTFRIYGDFENPMFLAKDVADWIDYVGRTGQLLNSVDDSEKLTHTIHASGQTREMWFLTEDGVYEVLMQSRKPIAKEFKKQVKEILRSIRKHGMYATDDLLNNPDLLIAAGQKLKEEQETRRRLEAKIEADKPKVLFADAVSASNTSILIRELAKILKQNGIDIGGTRLYALLREEGYLIKSPGTDWNTPTQRGMELGLFEIKETPVHHNSGNISISKTTKVTGRGQQYFIKKFLKQKGEIA